MLNPSLLDEDDVWVRRCPVCELPCQGGAAGLSAHWELIHGNGSGESIYATQGSASANLFWPPAP
jgi:hypothetical protein